MALHTDRTPDRDLLDRMARNEQPAFAQLYEVYWETLFVRANRILNSPDAAEDLVQDLFLNLWEKRRSLGHIQSLQAYLLTSLRHACVRFIHRHIDRFDFVDELSDALDKLQAEQDSSYLFDYKETEKIIGKAIAKMPSKMRLVFELSRNEGLSHKEISLKLGISTETVKKHIQHALQILKKELEKSDSHSKLILLLYLYTQF